MLFVQDDLSDLSHERHLQWRQSTENDLHKLYNLTGIVLREVY